MFGVGKTGMHSFVHLDNAPVLALTKVRERQNAFPFAQSRDLLNSSALFVRNWACTQTTGTEYTEIIWRYLSRIHGDKYWF